MGCGQDKGNQMKQPITWRNARYTLNNLLELNLAKPPRKGPRNTKPKKSKCK